MTLDLSFKELVDVAANPGGVTGRPLLVAIGCIDEDPDQPRRTFGEQELEELSQSIAEHGVLQPIVLRRSSQDGRYVIAMGARRYRAAQRRRAARNARVHSRRRFARPIRSDDREYPAR
ncbi:ParB/RepB/Spo0J family partition protein [Bradyrhizobium sp. USDA 4471]